MVHLALPILLTTYLGLASSACFRPTTTNSIEDPAEFYNSLDEGHKEFDQLVTPLLANKPEVFTAEMTKSVAKNANRTISAAKTMLAIALANRFVSEPIFGNTQNFVTDGLSAEPKTLAETLLKYIDRKADLEERYKKLVAQGKNPVDAFSSAMESYNDQCSSSFVLHVQQEFKNPPLGCKFDDDSYSTSGGRTVKWGKASNLNELKLCTEGKEKKGLFSKERLMFSKERGLKKVTINDFMVNLGAIAVEVLADTRYNDVDQLIRFVSEFKEQTKSLPQFYNTYKYKLRRCEDTAVYEIKLINQIYRIYTAYFDFPLVMESFYLVSAYKDIPDNIPLAQYETLLKESMHSLHGHIAGAFKILLDNKRRGYIIIDLNVGLNIPIIIMEDGEWPHLWHVTSENTRTKITSEHKLAKDGTLVSVQIHNAQNQLVTTCLYQVRQPYCSFMEDTYKRNLLMPLHGMVKRQGTGIKSGQIDFKILPKNMLVKDHHFNVMTYDESGRETVHMILFKDLNNMSKEHSKALDQVAQKLEITKADLLAKMAAIKMLLFDDEGLVNQMHALDNNLDKESNKMMSLIQNSPLSPDRQ